MLTLGSINAVNNANDNAMCEAYFHYEVENILMLLKSTHPVFSRSFFLAAFVTSDYKAAL